SGHATADRGRDSLLRVRPARHALSRDARRPAADAVPPPHLWGGKTRRDQMARRPRGAAGRTPGLPPARRRPADRAAAAGAIAIPAPSRVRTRPDPVPPRGYGGVRGGRPTGATRVGGAARRAGRPAVPGGPSFASPQPQ